MDSQVMSENASPRGNAMVKQSAPLPPNFQQARPQGPPTDSQKYPINNGPVGAPRQIGPPHQQLRRLDSRASLAPSVPGGQFAQPRPPYGPPRQSGNVFPPRPSQPGQNPQQNSSQLQNVRFGPPKPRPPNPNQAFGPGQQTIVARPQSAGPRPPSFTVNPHIQQPLRNSDQQSQQLGALRNGHQVQAQYSTLIPNFLSQQREPLAQRQSRGDDSSLNPPLSRQNLSFNAENKFPLRPRIVVEKMGDTDKESTILQSDNSIPKKKSEMRDGGENDDDDDVVMDNEKLSRPSSALTATGNVDRSPRSIASANSDNEKSPRKGNDPIDHGDSTTTDASKSSPSPRKSDEEEAKAVGRPGTTTIVDKQLPMKSPEPPKSPASANFAQTQDKEKDSDAPSRSASAKSETKTTDGNVAQSATPSDVKSLPKADDRNVKPDDKINEDARLRNELETDACTRPASAVSMKDDKSAADSAKTTEKSVEEKVVEEKIVESFKDKEENMKNATSKDEGKAMTCPVSPIATLDSRKIEENAKTIAMETATAQQDSVQCPASPSSNLSAKSQQEQQKTPIKTPAKTPELSRSSTPAITELTTETYQPMERSQANLQRDKISTIGDSSQRANESSRAASSLSQHSIPDNNSEGRSEATAPATPENQGKLSIPESLMTPPKSPQESVKGFDNGQRRSLSSRSSPCLDSPQSPGSPKSPKSAIAAGGGSAKQLDGEKKKTTFAEDSIVCKNTDDSRNKTPETPETPTSRGTSKPTTPTGKPRRVPTPAKFQNEKSDALSTSNSTTELENGSTANESSQDNLPTTNGVADSPTKKSPSKSRDSDKRSTAGSPTKSPSKSAKSLPRTPETPSSTAGSDKKKLPMNKVQVGAAPSPNLKTVRSKIGSLDNASYKPGGGKVKIENRKLDFSKAQPKIAAKNEKYTPSGGDKKIAQMKLQWNAKPKVGSLENATYKPGGGDKKIETVKLDFKDKAKPKVGSKDNAKHVPGGGSVKSSATPPKTPQDASNDIQTQKVDIKAESKVGSLDNVKHRPGGGDKKIFNDREYLKQTGSNVESLSGSGSQSPVPPGAIIDGKNGLPTSDENLNQEC